MSATAPPSCFGKGARLAPVLLLTVVAALLMVLGVSTQLRTGCADLLIRSGSSSKSSRKAGSGLAWRPDNTSHTTAAVRYNTITEHSVCEFFRVAWNQSHESMWGPWGLCDLDEPGAWLQRALSNCYSCLDPSRNVCRQPRRLIYNQYLVSLHPVWQTNLLSMQVFLLTQDLRRARLVVWTEDPASLVTNDTAPFFDAFAEHITVKRFSYSEEVVGTPWEGDGFFGNGSLVRSRLIMPAAWSDVVRLMLLHKYGHFWMDTDVVLYRDVSHLLDTCYQFVTRWTNQHVLRVEPGSKLSHRIMQTVLRMPMNHPNFTGEVMDKLCKPNGYITAHPVYNGSDIFNTCLFRVLIRNNNTGAPDAVLYDFPLGWWDHDWAGCFASRTEINDTHWRKVAGSTLAMHSRHPGLPKGVNPLGGETPPSPLRRVIKIVEDFFAQCSSPGCLPIDGMPLLAYESIGNASVVRSSRMRALLRLRQGRRQTQ